MYGPKVGIFSVHLLFLGRIVSELPFRGHIWAESDDIFHLEYIIGSKMAGFYI